MTSRPILNPMSRLVAEASADPKTPFLYSPTLPGRPGTSLTKSEFVDTAGRIATLLAKRKVGQGAMVKIDHRFSPVTQAVLLAACWMRGAGCFVSHAGEIDPDFSILFSPPNRNGGRHLVLDQERLMTLGDVEPQQDVVSFVPSQAVRIHYSSGTTGRPKDIELTAEGLSDRLRTVPDPIVTRDRSVTLVGPAAVSWTIMLSKAMVSGSLFVVPGTTPEEWVAAFDQTSMSEVILTVGHLRALVDFLKRTRRDLTFDRMLVMSDDLPRGLFDEAKKRIDAHFVTMYGTAEIGLVVECDNPAPGVIGQVIDGYLLEIVDDNGNVVEGDGVGVARVKPTTNEFLCRYQGGQSWESDGRPCGFVDGWFWTQDVIERSGDTLLFRGRTNDVINLFGQHINPRDVERVLERHNSVKEAAVIKIVDDDGTPTLAALIVGGTSHEMMRWLGVTISRQNDAPSSE